MKPDLTFIICTESGRLENKSALFAMSLRMFGGAFSECPILSIQPRIGTDISAETKILFDKLNVTHLSLPLNLMYPDYPLANKPLACAYAENICKTEILVFADSDQIILSEPTALLIDEDTDVLLRPVDVKNIGATDENEKNFAYWDRLYKLLTVQNHRHVVTTVCQQRILAYWNSGLIATRKNNRLFNLWENNFHTVMEQNLQPEHGMFFVEQSVFAATVCTTNLRVRELPNDYNYPIHMQSTIKNNKIKKINDFTTIHYHNIFEDEPEIHPLMEILLPNTQSTQVNELLSYSGMY